MSEPRTDSEKLRVLATWFDHFDDWREATAKIAPGIAEYREVQDDLRRIADRIEAEAALPVPATSTFRDDCGCLMDGNQTLVLCDRHAEAALPVPAPSVPRSWRADWEDPAMDVYDAPAALPVPALSRDPKVDWTAIEYLVDDAIRREAITTSRGAEILGQLRTWRDRALEIRDEGNPLALPVPALDAALRKGRRNRAPWEQGIDNPEEVGRAIADAALDAARAALPAPALDAIAAALHAMGLCRTKTEHSFRAHEPDAERLIAALVSQEDVK